MAKKSYITAGKAKSRGRDVAGHVKPDEDALVIKAAVWGQLEPLQRVSEEKIRRWGCLLYTSPSPRDGLLSRMPSSA